MSALELACFRLIPDVEISAPSLRANLLKAKQAMDHCGQTTQPCHFFHCVEDPSLIYLVGSWHSVEAHYDIFIPSETNQKLLVLFKDQITIEWMFHIALGDFECLQAYNVVLNEAVIAMERHFIQGGNAGRTAFQKTFEVNRKYLEEYIGRKEKVMGGWRIGGENEGQGSANEEFVLLTGWRSKQQHLDFANIGKYAKIRDHLEEADVKHAVKMDLERVAD